MSPNSYPVIVSVVGVVPDTSEGGCCEPADGVAEATLIGLALRQHVHKMFHFLDLFGCKMAELFKKGLFMNSGHGQVSSFIYLSRLAAKDQFTRLDYVKVRGVG
jgi:hypothetical protein